MPRKKQLVNDEKQYTKPGTSIYDPDVHPARVIELMREGDSIVAVCYDFGITRGTHYNWVEKYPEYKEAVEHGKVASQAWWEKQLKQGTIGKIPYFNSNAAAFSMKARFEDYREKSTENVTNNLILNLTDEQLNNRIMQMVKNTGVIDELQSTKVIDMQAEDVEYTPAD